MCIWALTYSSNFELRCLLEISTQFQQVVCINWTNTGDDFLVTAGKDKSASIWSMKTGQNVLQLDRHSESI